MPPVVQCSQIYLNLVFTYHLGRIGIKIIPNIRLGGKYTYSSLKAYPKHTLISIGTNGFIKSKENRKIFSQQVMKIIDVLSPSGILVYGSESKEIFDYAELKGIPVYQYDSYIKTRSQKDERK